MPLLWRAGCPLLHPLSQLPAFHRPRCRGRWPGPCRPPRVFHGACGPVFPQDAPVGRWRFV